MKLIEVTVKEDDGVGKAHSARLAKCDRCNEDKFLVFQIEGQTHFHLQCFVCGKAFCPAGESCQAPGVRMNR
jgi:hypothetical protein